MIILDFTKDTLPIIFTLIGGFWVGYKFFIYREQFPKVELSAEIKDVCNTDNQKILETVLTICNNGLVRHKIDLKTFCIKIHYLKKNDKAIQGDKNINFQTFFPNKLLVTNDEKRLIMNVKDEYTFIDPKTKQSYSYVFNVPEDSIAILIQYTFLYVEKKSEKQTFQITHKIN